MLFGNVLHWQTEYLGRQLPVLPARDGFPRKVKPLVRLTEREMAAYCVVRGIDYLVEECPMAAGNKHLGYKEALNDIEAHVARRQARLLLRLPRPGRGPLRARRPRPTGPSSAPAAPAGRPTTAEVCAFCRLVERAGGAVPEAGTPTAVPVELGPTRSPHRRLDRRRLDRGRGRPMSRPFAAGDQVLLIDHKKRRYLVTLKAGGEFHSHAGFVPHDDDHRRARGRRPCGRPATARTSRCRPTLSDFVLKMPRGAQVIYPKDLGPILMLADIFPGARVLESGVGSGALSMTMLRAGADIVGYELREDFADRAQENVGVVPRRRGAGALPGSSCATATTASTRPTSTGSCSTCPSRGRS